MFDWEDQELANIIWGDAGEDEDHIVPYPDETNEKPPGSYGEHSKEWDQEPSTVKLSEKKTLPESSLSNAAKSNLESIDEKAQVDSVPQFFDSQSEVRDKNEFVEYRWANMGSFDELDRILSNDDPMFGHVNISGAEALWSSPKDVIDCPEKSVSLSIDSPSLQLGALRSDFEHVETKAGFMEDENQSNPSHEKMNDQSCHTILGFGTNLKNLEGKNTYVPKKKVGGQRKSLQAQKTTREKGESKPLQTSCRPRFSLGNQGIQYEGRCSMENSSPQMRNQQFESSWYKQFTNRLPQIQSGEENHQKVPSASSNLSDQLPDAPLISPSMTPQEKIEKLRRRQQMRAILAIRKQQQQIRPQVSCIEDSIFPRCSNGSQMQFSGNMEVDENLSTLMSFDVSSVVDQNDSVTIPVMDINTMEDTILLQLEDVVARLDIQIRLCIRDSLFRLAQSSIQRRDAGDSSSNNKKGRDEISAVTEERSNRQKSSAGVPDVETETNPIDRAVAHLLFHRPPELSVKLPESPTSALFSEFPCETKASPSTSLPMGLLNESYEDVQAMNISCIVDEGNESKRPCMDPSENESSNKTADGGVMEVSAIHDLQG